MCGFAPGGTTDLLSRVIGEFVGPDFGQNVVVENRTGASGMIAADAVAKAAPDLIWPQENQSSDAIMGFASARSEAFMRSLHRQPALRRRSQALPRPASRTRAQLTRIMPRPWRRRATVALLASI
jgi:hypothetical protein